MTSPRRAKTTAAQRRGTGNKRQLRLLLATAFPAYEVTEEETFHPTRRWRFDFAVPSLRIGVEYQGHGQTGKIRTKTGEHVGGHGSITGLSRDCDKANAAAALGWTVLSFTALHFDPAARRKHKLTHPLDALREVASATLKK